MEEERLRGLKRLAFVTGFAAAAHAGQRYGAEPYVEHLAAVALVLTEHGCHDVSLLEAAWLHDVLEDTRTTREILLEHFAPEVVALVEAVTDEPGATRAERKARTYAKTRAHHWAVPVKLADRIANVRACLEGSEPRLLAMYREEHAAFEAALNDGKSWQELWRTLKELI